MQTIKTTKIRNGQITVPPEILAQYNLKEGDKLIWLDDGKAIKVVPVLSEDVVAALEGASKGRKLTERLLAERKLERKHEKIRA